MSWALSHSRPSEPSSYFSSAPLSMNGWLSSSPPICASRSGVVSWAVMSACQQPCWIGSLIARRFSNLLELLIAFASSSTDRKERRRKHNPKSRSDGPLCVRCGSRFGLILEKSEPACFVLQPAYPAPYAHIPTRGELTTGKSISSPHSCVLAHAAQSQPASS